MAIIYQLTDDTTLTKDYQFGWVLVIGQQAVVIGTATADQLELALKLVPPLPIFSAAQEAIFNRLLEIRKAANLEREKAAEL